LNFHQNILFFKGYELAEALFISFIDGKLMQVSSEYIVFKGYELAEALFISL